MNKRINVALAFIAAVGVTGTQAASVSTSSGALSVSQSAGAEVVVSVSGPGDFQAQRSYPATGAGSAFANRQLSLAEMGATEDGHYSYEVAEYIPSGSPKLVYDPENGRDGVWRQPVTTSVITGHFDVLNGSVVPVDPNAIESSAAEVK